MEEERDPAVADSGLDRADQADSTDVDTPFAWTESDDEEAGEADDGPPISDYFSRLLSWGGDEEDAAGDDDA